MRMLIAVVAASLPLTTSAAAPQPQPPAPPQKAEPPADWAKTPEQCERAKVHYTDSAAPAKTRKLTELPPGNLQLAVHREVEGCPVPVIVRYNFTSGN